MLKRFQYFIIILTVATLAACSKPNDPTPTPPTPPVVPPVTPTTQTCIMSGVSQRNSGTKAEFAITVVYNSTLAPTTIVVYDSASSTHIYDATLTYAAADSIRLNAYEYIKLDASKRVSLFITRSDMTDAANSDVYRYQYVYNTDGYLATKYLLINGSANANYTTTYTYTGTQLTGCSMVATSSGNLKILDATISYESTLAPKRMMYTFPDGFENFYFTAALNYGTRPVKLMSQMVTKIYNPGTGAVIDTWTTNYSGYSLDTNGYLVGGTATGDLQQGVAAFYGKTFFSYQCQ